MLEGTVALEDLPEIWDARMKEFLGVDVPHVGDGVLQDVHWSGGGIGYFPTYALGNVISLQLWAVVREALPDLDAQLAAGELAQLSSWLRDNLYSLGRKLTPKETLERADGLADDRPAAVPRVPRRQDRRRSARERSRGPTDGDPRGAQHDRAAGRGPARARPVRVARDAAGGRAAASSIRRHDARPARGGLRALGAGPARRCVEHERAGPYPRTTVGDARRLRRHAAGATSSTALVHGIARGRAAGVAARDAVARALAANTSARPTSTST